MATRLSDERLAELRAQALKPDGLARADIALVLIALDETRSQLAALKAEHADSDYWRKAFERLRDSDNRETRDRLDRMTSGATR